MVQLLIVYVAVHVYVLSSASENIGTCPQGFLVNNTQTHLPLPSKASDRNPALSCTHLIDMHPALRETILCLISR